MMAYIGIHSSEIGLGTLPGPGIQLPFSIECVILLTNCYLMLLPFPRCMARHGGENTRALVDTN